MKKRNKLKRTLLVILLIMMTLPFIFSFVPTIRGKALFGIQPVVLKKISIEQIKDHTWQDQVEDYIRQNIGFANHGVRLLNEINYHCFRYSSAPKLVIGKDGYFFEDTYLNEYMGSDFVGESTIIQQVGNLKNAQEQLQRKGITLLLVIEPGKARFMPEFLPRGCRKGTNTNYDSFVKELHKQGVSYLDLNQYFREKRRVCEYPLYSRHGIHWSTYGMWTAADTLQRFIEAACALKLPGIEHISDSLSDKNKDLDFDLEPPMNLLHELSHETLRFPIMKFDTTVGSKSSALIIADSYVWSLWEHGIIHHWFDQPDYWYYNNSIYPDIWEPGIKYVNHTQIAAAIQQKKIILLMMTDANLRDFGWGFIQEVIASQE